MLYRGDHARITSRRFFIFRQKAQGGRRVAQRAHPSVWDRSKTLESLRTNSAQNAGEVVTNFNQFGRIVSLNPAVIRDDEQADPRLGKFGIRVMAGNRQSPSIVKAFADLWRTVSTDLFGAYHPERHYMRGPGPKWRAKHAHAVAEPNLAGMANVSA